MPMRVVEHAPVSGCGEAVVPMVEYRVDGPDIGPCVEWLGLAAEAGVLPLPGLEAGADVSCLDAMGLRVGASIAGLVAVQGKGDCAPVVLQPSGDARGCVVCE